MNYTEILTILKKMRKGDERSINGMTIRRDVRQRGQSRKAYYHLVGSVYDLDWSSPEAVATWLASI